MRNANLNNTNHNRTFPFENPSEQEKQLKIYKQQAWMYLMKNLEAVIRKYAYYILDELCKQSSFIKNNYQPFEDQSPSHHFERKSATELIEKYITLYEEMLILYNPEDIEPCVVVDAYVFTDYDIEAFEERMLIEYIQNNPNSDESASQSAFAKEAVIRAARYGAGYGMGRMGASLTHTATRLSALSNHYASGHKTLMRVERSFRGKKAQREALFKLLNKSSKYGKSAAERKVVGTVLTKLATLKKRSVLRPITLLDVFKPHSFGQRTPMEGWRETAESHVLPELIKYCEQHNNYQTIINQQYISNADK